jgi:uncharacterized membrane protein YsdA (DUF1294 family)
MTYFFSYLVIVNILAFLLMGIDKRKAKKGAWRIPEQTLFLSALIGGSLGANLGMQLFRHKTKHRSFVIGMPAILIVQLLLGFLLYIVA